MFGRTVLRCTSFILLVAWAGFACAVDLSQPLVLVAKPGLRDPLFGSSVLVVMPGGGDEHIGFIVNRPTDIPLARAFPEHGPAQKIYDPIYVGGPFAPELVFALVQRPQNPGGRSVELMAGLFVAYEEEIVDMVIDKLPQHARFVAGFFAWDAGELQEQIDQGLWYALPADAALAVHEPQGLWQELVRRCEAREHLI